FRIGHRIGHNYGCTPGHEDNSITSGQAIGQKNTVVAIWMGYTFLTPETSIVGGFYSIWHNLYNSWEINRHEKH
ncbi:MAG: transporter, partial [Candidatus Cryptobacteroides sp.]